MAAVAARSGCRLRHRARGGADTLREESRALERLHVRMTDLAPARPTSRSRCSIWFPSATARRRPPRWPASVELARLAERLGYRRLWVAEHHNMPGIASSSPAVLIAHLAASTDDDPGRRGRRDASQPRGARRRRAVRHARGAASRPHRSRARARARHRSGHRRRACAAARRSAADEFPEQLRDLFLFFDGAHPQITAVPGRGYRPAVWMLGSSDFSAQVAGRARPAVLVRASLRVAQHGRRARDLPRRRSVRRPSWSSRTR